MHTCNPSSQDSEAVMLEAQENSVYVAGNRKERYNHTTGIILLITYLIVSKPWCSKKCLLDLKND